MSTAGEDDRLDDENVEYNHRNESGDEQSEGAARRLN